MAILDVRFASKIIEKIKQSTNYNINIMNERGIIIASINRDRIGTFHEAALTIMQGKRNDLEVRKEDHLVGSLEGVNLALFYNGEKIGVLGITGNPDEVWPIALILRVSIESMLEYEMQNSERQHRRSLKEQFLNRIIYGEDVTSAELQEYATRLELDEKLVRIPVIFYLDGNLETVEMVLAGIREFCLITKQDVLGVTRSNDLILLKHFEEPVMKLIREYKYILAESISSILRYLKSRDFSYTVYVGSFQNRFENYRISYQQCNWMRNYFPHDNRSYYLYEHLDQYYRSFVPLQEMRGVYEIFKSQIDARERENMLTLMTALSTANFNLNEASKLLHVHKNTLIYRLDKLREEFGMNPIQSNKDREFIVNMCNYLTMCEN